MLAYFAVPVPLMLTWDIHTGTDGRQTSLGLSRDSQQQDASQEVGIVLKLQPACCMRAAFL